MERFKLTPAVYLFLVKYNKILLLRRYNTGYEDGNYSMPAGHLDGGETITQALIREALEETCVHLKPEDIKVVHVMHRFQNDTRGERLDFFLSATKWNGEVRIGEPNKCDDLSWFPLDSLPENVIPYVRSAIDSISKGIFYSEFGW